MAKVKKDVKRKKPQPKKTRQGASHRTKQAGHGKGSFKPYRGQGGKKKSVKR